MELTVKQCELILGMYKASVTMAMNSGIPIGKEYYEDIDEIRDKINEEMRMAIVRERGGCGLWS